MEELNNNIGSAETDENVFPADNTDGSGKDAASDNGDDIYVYDDKEDEPVDDKDLYRDFDALSKPITMSVSETNVVSAASGVGTAKKAVSEPAKSETATNDTEKRYENAQTVHNAVSEPVKNETAVNGAERHYDNAQTAHNAVSEPVMPKMTSRDYAPTVGYDKIEIHEEHEDTSPHIRINKIYMVNTVISMITLCAVAASVFTGYAYIKKLEQDLGLSKRRITELEDYHTEETQSARTDQYVDAISLIDEEELKEPDIPAEEAEIDIEKGKLLLYDSYVGYSWVPVISGLKAHSYNKADLHVDDDNRMEYRPNGEVSSYFGIDVSQHQGDIDWDAVRSDGVEFAVLRIGVRGYAEEGNIKLDEKFYENYENAHKAGVDLGVYFYSQAISVEEAIEEANFVLEKLDGRKLEYPIVFDWEPVDTNLRDVPPRTEDVMPGTLTLSAVAFCETVQDAGYKAMIYTNKKMAYIKYDMRKLKDYPVWLALYNTDLTYYYDFDMWQYGFGKVDGIEGDVDLDIAFIK